MKNEGYPASLLVRRLYEELPDASAEEHGLVRIIDESGKDYLYPRKFFVALDIPKPVARAMATGHSTSELLRKGLRVIASRYYSGRRPPTTALFESTDNKLGDEALLFKDIED